MAKELVQLELGIDFEREGATAKNLQATLRELQKNFKLKLNIDVANDTGTMDKLVKKVEEVSKAIQKTNEEGGFEKTTEEALKLQDVLEGMKTLKVTQVFDGKENLQQTKVTLKDIDGVIKQIKSDAKNNVTQIVETDNIEKQEQAIRKQAEAIAKAKEKMDDFKQGLQDNLRTSKENGLINPSILRDLQTRLDKLNVDSPKKSIQSLDNAINNLSKSETRIVSLQKAIDKAKQALSNAKLSDAFNDTTAISKFENIIKQAQGSMMNRLKKNSQSVTNFDFSSTIDELKQFTSQFNTTVSKNETYILRLEKSLTELQTRFREISSDSKAMKMDGVKESLQSIETEIVKTTELMNNLTNGKSYKGTDIDRQIMNNNNSLKEMKSTLKSTTSEVTSFSDKVMRIFGNVGIYTSAYEIINKVGREFKNAIEYVTQLDDALTGLKKVLGDNETLSTNFMNNMHDLAMNMGTQSDKAVEAVEMWKKTGQSLGDSQTLAKTTLMTDLVGDVGDVSKAQEYLVSPMVSFNKTASETIGIVDELNNLSNNMATDFNDIGEGLSRSASVMATAGNDLEQTNAMIATLEASTKRGGQTVGNSLKTIALRLAEMKDEETGEPLPKLKEQLEELGVQVVDSAGQIRSTFDIYRDLGGIWKNLSKNKQVELSEVLGGKLQSNMVSALLNNIDELNRAYDLASNSAGSATDEFSTYQESVSYKLGQLEESIKQFYTTLVSSDAIKSFADMGITMMEALTGLTDKFGLMPVAITGTVTALLLLNKHFRTTMTNFTSMFTPIGKFNGLMDTLKVKLETSALATEKQIKAIKIMTATNQTAGQSTNMLGVKLAGLEAKLMATRAGVIATRLAIIALQTAMTFLITGVISLGISALDNFIHRSEKLKESNEDLRTSFTSLGDDIESLSNSKTQYEELSKAMQDESITTEELKNKKSELSNLINSLTNQYPELIGVLGNANTTYEEQAKAIQGVIDAKKEEQAIKASQYFSDNDISGMEDINKKIKDLKKYQEEIKNLEKGEITLRGVKLTKEDTVGMQDVGKLINDSLSEARGNAQDLKQQLRDILLYNDQLVKYNGEGIISEAEANKISKLIQNTQLMGESEKLAKNEIEKATEATQNQVNVQEQLSGVLANSSTALQEYASNINGADWSKDKTPAEIYGSAIDEVEKLQGYINEMNSEAGYTPQLVSELIQQYPELGSRINDASAVQDFLNQKIADQVSIQEQAYEIMVGNDTEFYNSKIRNNEEFQASVNRMLSAFVDESGNAYSIDLNNYDNLNAMKQDALSMFAQGVNNFLKQFVDGNGQAYQVDLQNFNNLAQAKAEALNKLNGLLKRLQQNTITALGAQQQAYKEMSAMATGGVLGLEKAKGEALPFYKMAQDTSIMNAYADNAKKIAEVKGKIQEIEDLGGLDLKGYSAQTYNGSAFSPSLGGSGGKSGKGGKGGSGSSSAQKVQEDMEKLSDRYWDLNNAISKCESELKKFNTQMEHATDDQKISGLNRQLDLLNKQRDAYKKLREEQQKELWDKRVQLDSFGFRFADDWNINNYNSQIDKLVNEANAIQDADAKKARQEVVKNIQKTAEEYNKLLNDSIPETDNTIDDILNDIIDAQEEVADILEKQRDKYIDNLKEQYDKRKEYLQKEKDLMNKTYEEQDRKDELKEKEETIIKLKEQLQDAIREGNTEIQKNLWEQIQEAQNEINKFIRDAELEDANDMFDNSMDNLDDELDDTINKIEEQLSDEQILAMVQSGVRDLNSVLEEIGNSSQNVDTLFQNLTSYTDDWVTNITSFKDILESIKATNLGLLTTGVDYSNLNSKASMTSVGNISVAVNVNGSLTDDNYARFADMISDMAVEKVNNELKNY